MLSLLPHCYELSISARKDDDNLNAEDQIGGKTCLMTIDSGASVISGDRHARHLCSVLPKRELTQPYILQMVWWRPCIDTTDPGTVASEDLSFCCRGHNKFVLGLDALHARMDLGC